MGATGSVKIIKRPPPAKIQFQHIQDEIKKQLKPVGQQHVNERNKITSDFETEIKFGYRISTTEKQVTLSIVVENSEQSASEGFSVGDLWKALDKTGIRPHTIIPKQATRLSFVTGYQPHTRPIARSGGPGRATGERVFARMVNHPGYPPRKFSETIAKRLKRQYEQAIDRGVRLGSKKR